MPANWIKKIIHYTWRPFIIYYLRKDRIYRYKDIVLKIHPGVFHPGFFFSSHLLLDFIRGKNLKYKRVLEPGAGSGLLAIFAAKKGAEVTATDINRDAVNGLIANADLNKVNITVLHSDLFQRIPVSQFDFILINPPYYRKKPETAAEYAWYSGEDMEYFNELFSGLFLFMHAHTQVYMVLSEDCDITGIMAIAAKNKFIMEEVLKRKRLWEWNYIYRFYHAGEPAVC